MGWMEHARDGHAASSRHPSSTDSRSLLHPSWAGIKRSASSWAVETSCGPRHGPEEMTPESREQPRQGPAWAPGAAALFKGGHGRALVSLYLHLSF